MQLWELNSDFFLDFLLTHFIVGGAHFEKTSALILRLHDPRVGAYVPPDLGNLLVSFLAITCRHDGRLDLPQVLQDFLPKSKSLKCKLTRFPWLMRLISFRRVTEFSDPRIALIWKILCEMAALGSPEVGS